MGPMRIFGEEFNTLDIKINFIATTLAPVRSSQQVQVTPHYTIANAPKMDIVFIPGGIYEIRIASILFQPSHA